MSSDADKAMARLQESVSLKAIYGKQNEHMIYSLQKAYSVTLELVAKHKLTVLESLISDGKPLLTIEHINGNDFFEWNTKFTSTCPDTGAILHWGAKELSGILIQWQIRGALH